MTIFFDPNDMTLAVAFTCASEDLLRLLTDAAAAETAAAKLYRSVTSSEVAVSLESMVVI